MKKKWEEIIKEKIDEPSGNLPESVFEEFHARLEAGGSAAGGQAGSRGAKRRPLLWALAPAAAAALAAVLLLRQPSAPQAAVQVAPQSAAPVADAVATEPPDPAEPAMQTVVPGPILNTVTPVAYRQSASSNQDTEGIVSAGSAEESVGADRTDEAASFEPAVTPQTENQPDNYTSEPIPAVSPYKPEGPAAKPVTMKVAPAAGIIAGGGLLAAILVPLLESGLHMSANTLPANDFTFDGGRWGAPEPPDMSDRPLGGHEHHPVLFKGGLSIGIPVAKRLKITTGLEYSEYRSSFTWQFKTGMMMTEVGEKEQLVQYLGVPLRLDWSLAKNNWLDVYVGAGAQADYCIGATLTDIRIGKQRDVETLERDGFVFSLLGAGGIQLNANKRIGLYIEPEIVWTGGKPSKTEEVVIPGRGRIEIPTEESIGLQTYRTEHPFMFSVSTGLRINLGK